MKVERKDENYYKRWLYQCINTLIFIGILLFTLIFPQKVYAAFSYTIDSVSSLTISDKEQIVSVALTILDLPSGDSYFRVGINEGGSYVGYNKVGADWIKLVSLSEDETNKTCSKYMKINSDGTYVIDFKIGTDTDITNGDHVIKAHRFRSTCTIDALKPEVAVLVLLPTPTPTPTQTTTPQPTATQTPTSTVTATAKPTPAKTSTPKSTTSQTPIKSGQADEPVILEKNDSIVLQTPTSTGLVAGASTSNNKSKTIAIILIFFGICFLGYCGFLIYNSKNAKVEGSS